MYEHIKKSELKQGRSKDRAKEIAAATVVKHYNEHDHHSGRWSRDPPPVVRRSSEDREPARRPARRRAIGHRPECEARAPCLAE